MKKTFKIMFITTFIIMYMSYTYFGYNQFVNEIKDTYFYKLLTDDMISVKSLIKQNPLIYKKDITKLGKGDTEEKANELFIDKSINQNKYWNKTLIGFDYLTKLEGLNSLVYDFNNTPKNFNETLKKIPDLKWFKYEGQSYGEASGDNEIIEDDINLIKDLNIEHFEGKLAGWDALTVINTYKNLKTAKVYTDLYDRLDQASINISNDSLEQLNLYIDHSSLYSFSETISRHNKDLYFLKGEYISEDENEIKEKFAIKLNLHTPNLKEFVVDFEYREGRGFPIDVRFTSDKSDSHLDSLTLSNGYRPKLIADNKIKVDEVCLINTDFDNLYIDEVLAGVEFESIKKMYISNGSYDIYNTRKKESKFLNLTELEIKNSYIDINNINFAELMPVLKILKIQSTNISDEEAQQFYSVSNLGQASNLEYLSFNINNAKNDEIIQGFDELKNLKNLKTLVVNSEISSMLPKLDGVNIIIE